MCQTLTPLTLELGGKSPAFVDKGFGTQLDLHLPQPGECLRELSQKTFPVPFAQFETDMQTDPFEQLYITSCLW